MRDINTKKEGAAKQLDMNAELAIQKQYELLIGIFQAETGRFWTRFNIFTGIQLLALLGILSNLNVLSANSSILRHLILLFALVSTLFVAICIRGIMSSRMLLSMIGKLELESQYLVKLVKLAEEHDRLPQYVNFILAFVIALLLSVTWWFAFTQVGVLVINIST